MALFVLLFFLTAGPALADADACIACCKAAGLAGCPTRVRVFGDGSIAAQEMGGWRVKGIWWLGCDEIARFDDGATVVLDHVPAPGEILLAGNPADTARCFAQSCSLPASGCLEVRDSAFRLMRCTDGRPLSQAEMRVAGNAPTQTRVVNREQNPGTTPPPPASAQLDLPAPPGTPCHTASALQSEALRRIELGDQAAVAGHTQRAADEYRAALTMDRCSARAWAAIGRLALRVRRPDLAATALASATQLAPRQPEALTDLGLAYELLGQLEQAEVAYTRALTVSPGHPSAAEGLIRVQTQL